MGKAFFISLLIHGLFLCNATVTRLTQSETFLKIDDKYFIVNKDANVNWYEAERLCRQYGYLAEFENKNQLQNMFQYLSSLGLLRFNQWYWTAGNDLGSEGTFYSAASGEALAHAKWTPGQPDNAANNEHCIHLWKDSLYTPGFGMNDAPCERKAHYICEIKI